METEPLDVTESKIFMTRDSQLVQCVKWLNHVFKALCLMIQPQVSRKGKRGVKEERAGGGLKKVNVSWKSPGRCGPTLVSHCFQLA